MLKSWRFAIVFLSGLLAIYLVGSQHFFLQKTVVVNNSIKNEVGSESSAIGSSTKSRVVKPELTTGLEALPHSFINTEVDGQFRTDANGSLIINSDIIRIFDYFFSALGDESEQQIIARIHTYIKSQLKEPAQSQAMGLLENVISAQKELGELDSQVFIPNLANISAQTAGLDIKAFRRKKEQIHNIRLKHLPLEAVNAFYGDENVYDNYSLTRMEIMLDKSLTPLDKSQRLSELKRTLPKHMQNSLAQTNQLADLKVLSEQLKKQGASTQEIKQMQINLVGEKAANRLAKVEQQQQQWQNRVDNWLVLREQIKSQTNIDEASINKQIETLRSEQFSGLESKRIQSLERIHDQRNLQ